ncbi:hypothetical protein YASMINEVIRUS_769 [Yasminevirus sp. GU-2018]|uniref:Uncharacterized protein n=1 Tax=Yasminevirus sp. GU-2018 TaxID=2420051 RepID=A0A5K0UB59_9VIRU|nr:hypothetical protein YASMINEVIRUS_769 [Yasminevirus sp. GU-2018]
MFKLVVVPLSSVGQIDPQRVVLNNLQIADSAHNLQLMICASMGWFQLYKGKTYYDLESYLRSHDMNTHLIAKRNPVIPDNCKLVVPGYSPTDPKSWMEYEVIFSCRPKPYATAEVLTHWPTLDTNREALKKAGGITGSSEQTEVLNVKPTVLSDGSVIKKLPDEFLKETSPLAKLQRNEAILHIIPV